MPNDEHVYQLFWHYKSHDAEHFSEPEIPYPH